MSDKKRSITSPSRSRLPGTGQLRIIGGKWRGRKIHFPDSEGLRPTGDRIRETLFNWLIPDIEDARCLDLFAGSGALTFEALSRGAAQVVCIDSQRRAARQLDETSRLLQCNDAVHIICDSAQHWLEQPTISGPFDVVFLDPPFGANLLTSICLQLQHSGLLSEHALIYLEYGKDQQLIIPNAWQPLKHKSAGGVHYALYRQQP